MTVMLFQLISVQFSTLRYLCMRLNSAPDCSAQAIKCCCRRCYCCCCWLK